MEIKEVRATVSFTKNLGNYQSLHIEAGATSEVEPGEKVDTVFTQVFQLVKEEVKKQTLHCIDAKQEWE